MTVPPVKNDTAQVEVGGWLQAELRKELAGRGRLSEGGVPLEVELIALRTNPTASSGEGGGLRVEAWRIEAELRAHAGDFEDTALGSEEYLAGVDVPGTEANRRAALRRLARDLARELVERFEVSGRMRP